MLDSALLALAATLPLLATASPIAKRYTNQYIISDRTGTCLKLPNGVTPADGVMLEIGSCANATTWDIDSGSGSVIVSGTDFALDAGTNPHDNVPAKIWQSYPGVTQQTWYFTSDGRIAITGGTQCLDAGDNGPQTYTCTTGDTNQGWRVQSPLPAGGGDPAANSSQIIWNHEGQNKCLYVDGSVANGTPVKMGECLPGSDPNANNQLWVSHEGGSIEIGSSGYCLDAGENPSDGTGLKIWQCYDGLAQQTWRFITNDRIMTANNQCIDVNNSNDVDVQTWSCSFSDPQQMFHVATVLH